MFLLNVYKTAEIEQWATGISRTFEYIVETNSVLAFKLHGQRQVKLSNQNRKCYLPRLFAIKYLWPTHSCSAIFSPVSFFQLHDFVFKCKPLEVFGLKCSTPWIWWCTSGNNTQSYEKKFERVVHAKNEVQQKSSYWLEPHCECCIDFIKCWEAKKWSAAKSFRVIACHSCSLFNAQFNIF